MSISPVFLRRFAKTLCVFTWGLIFLGGLVKSTDSGLSVPDWPTTYGHFMFAFPLSQMVGGIKFEHTHRMLASIVGLMSLILCISLLLSKVPTWIKRLGIWTFVIVILQGVLGGLTVLFYLPVWLSTFHGVLAQTFFVLTIIIAYGLSFERSQRLVQQETYDPALIKASMFLTGAVYIQLIWGNLMRHMNAGLAVPDFPTMGGTWLPTMDQAMLGRINAWRFMHNLDPVTMAQVHMHLTHRFWALLVLFLLFYVNKVAYERSLNRALVMKTVFWLNMALVIQITLGIATVLSRKEVVTTTFHVAVGALVLALSFLLLLRSAPVGKNDLAAVLRRR